MQKYAATQSVAQMSNYTDLLCGDSNTGSSDRLRSFQFFSFNIGAALPSEATWQPGGNKHIMPLRCRDYHDKSFAVPI